MNAERWRQIDELFDAVLEIPNERRGEFLTEKCNGDDDLKREVLSLLDAQRETERFMENSAMNLMAKEIAHDRTDLFSYVGKEFGTYKIEKLIGAGGMGEVYLAHDDKLKRKVAMKILPAEFVADAERVKRFEREARMISALNHPYIVTIYDVGCADGVNFIATEFVEGETVRELINRGVDLKQTLSIISQTCEALAAAHKAGIIHRDIKPENIMIRPDGFVKVLDFGLAKLTENTELQQQSLSNYTMKGIIIGTPAYMSPKQVSDEKIDHRTDLWSLGVVLYEMLTGKNPFKGETRQATFQKILSENPLHITETNEQLPAELDAVLSKALEKDAEVSYQTASDLRADLKRIRRDIDSSPSLRSSFSTQKSKNSKPARGFLIPAAILILPLVGLLVWYFYSKQIPNQTLKPVDWSKAQNIQATDTLSVENYPSLSPDGKTLVFSMDSDDNEDIYSQRVGGKNLSNLTADSKKADTMPAFSPNGQFIAFRSERKPEGIYVMGATAENVRRVSDIGFHPSWSPDGKKLVVSERFAIHHTLHTLPNSSLWTIDVASGSKQPLDTKGGDAIMPSWSPNGQRIAYWFVQAGKPGEIATVSADGGEPVVITNDDFSDWNPVWSPDGKFLYFASDRSGSMSLWRVAIDEATGKVAGEPESVGTSSKYCRHITFSRDGSLLGYVRYESKSNLQTVAFDPQTKKSSRRTGVGNTRQSRNYQPIFIAERRKFCCQKRQAESGRFGNFQPRRHELAKFDRRQISRKNSELVARRQTHRVSFQPEREKSSLDDKPGRFRFAADNFYEKNRRVCGGFFAR